MLEVSCFSQKVHNLPNMGAYPLYYWTRSWDKNLIFIFIGAHRENPPLFLYVDCLAWTHTDVLCLEPCKLLTEDACCPHQRWTPCLINDKFEKFFAWSFPRQLTINSLWSLWSSSWAEEHDCERFRWSVWAHRKPVVFMSDRCFHDKTLAAEATSKKCCAFSKMWEISQW